MNCRYDRRESIVRSFVYINPEVDFTLRIRMFESIAEQITDDFLSCLYRIPYNKSRLKVAY